MGGGVGAIVTDGNVVLAAAVALLAALLRDTEMAEKLIERIVRIEPRKIRHVRILRLAGHADIDHRSTITLDDGAHVRQGCGACRRRERDGAQIRRSLG